MSVEDLFGRNHWNRQSELNIIFTNISLPLGVSCEHLTAVNHEEFNSEGNSVTLSYKYSKKAAANEYFLWYRQYPGKPPEFLLSHTGTGTKLQNLVPRMSFNVTEESPSAAPHPDYILQGDH
uniref:Immunoglobulin V-set domain-containing protein n=1 Tax=Anabas testudineus TaxID=64144 RepID=A0A3Q1HW17_ANATE